ncbi:unnamed protein product [Caenorhabditis sp. 36 PRJEB53466]|nr:unnamed protein product [Caenorhabditis sp. 36 PRJEB53466]
MLEAAANLVRKLNREKSMSLEIISSAQRQVARLTQKISDLTVENEGLKMRRFSSEPEKPITEAICGVWKIVSSINSEEYAQKRREHLNCGDLDDIVFQMGQLHFRFDGNVLTGYTQVADKIYHRQTIEIGKTLDQMIYQEVTRIEENRLKTVFLNKTSGEEYSRAEKFVRDGRLFVVDQRFGITCTRIYERVDLNTKDVVKERNELRAKVISMSAQLEKMRLKVCHIPLLPNPSILERKNRVKAAITGTWRLKFVYTDYTCPADPHVCSNYTKSYKFDGDVFSATPCHLFKSDFKQVLEKLHDFKDGTTSLVFIQDNKLVTKQTYTATGAEVFRCEMRVNAMGNLEVTHKRGSISCVRRNVEFIDGQDPQKRQKKHAAPSLFVLFFSPPTTPSTAAGSTQFSRRSTIIPRTCSVFLTDAPMSDDDLGSVSSFDMCYKEEVVSGGLEKNTVSEIEDIKQQLLEINIKLSEVKMTSNAQAYTLLQLESDVKSQSENQQKHVEKRAEVPIQKSINGKWKLVESVNVNEYLARRPNPTIKERIMFLMGEPQFEVIGDRIKIIEVVQSKECRQECRNDTITLGKRFELNGYYHVSRIENNCLKTVFFFSSNGEEFMREKRFVKGGLLHRNDNEEVDLLKKKVASLTEQLEEMQTKNEYLESEMEQRKLFSDLGCPPLHDFFTLPDWKLSEKQPKGKENIRTQIVGEWKMVASINLDEFLSVNVPDKEQALDWKHKTVKYMLEDDQFTSITGVKQVSRTQILGTRISDGCNRTILTYIEGESVVSIVFDVLEEEVSRSKMFIKDGVLRVLNLEKGITCKRIYEKVSE